MSVIRVCYIQKDKILKNKNVGIDATFFNVLRDFQIYHEYLQYVELKNPNSHLDYNKFDECITSYKDTRYKIWLNGRDTLKELIISSPVKLLFI